MPQCPRCSTEIDHLVEVNQYYHEFGVRLINGHLDPYPYTLKEYEVDAMDFPYWACPSCDDGLFDEESSVIAFLKGERDWVLI
mgnify:CR=1 FL=1